MELDEPDGVAGVVAVRNSELTIQEEIFEFESTGKFLICNDSFHSLTRVEPTCILSTYV